VRKQYHFQASEKGLLAWDVERLVAPSRDLSQFRLTIDSIGEIDEVYWFDDDEQTPTCRRVIEHARLIHEADLSYPIILSADGRVMDGMHRVGKALLEGRLEIEAVKFDEDPEPDFVGRRPSTLPY